MNLSNVSFPIYYLGKEKPEEVNGILFYIRVDDNGEYVYYIIDDKNLPGNTIGKRRLQIDENVKKFSLRKAIFYIQDLIKITHSLTWFVDNNGKLFSYKKSKVVPLIFKRILKVIPNRVGGAILEIEGLPTRFKTLHIPPVEHKYAGMLKLSPLSYILYGTYDRKYKDTTRKI